MKDFFKQNKIFLAIVIGALIIGEAIVISGRLEKPANQPNEQTSGGECLDLPQLPDGALKLVTKIIDGDTFLIEGGYPVRILGIDADERGDPCYEAAKTGLEDLILNREVRLETPKHNKLATGQERAEDKDRWCRYLRYVFLDGKNIGLELVQKGLAIARFSPDNLKYREEIMEAEKKAKENKVGCKWSSSP